MTVERWGWYSVGLNVLLAARNAEGWVLAALAATGALPLVFGHFELRAGRAGNESTLPARTE